MPNTWLLRPEENERGEQEKKAEAIANGAKRQTRLRVMNNTFAVTYFFFFFMAVESPRSEEPSQECELCIQRKEESLLVEAVVDEAGTSYLRSTEVPPKLFLTLQSLAMTPGGRKKNKQKKPKKTPAPVARYRSVL